MPDLGDMGDMNMPAGAGGDDVSFSPFLINHT